MTTEKYTTKVTDDPLYLNYMALFLCLFGTREDGRTISVSYALTRMKLMCWRKKPEVTNEKIK